jgi:hypothetical protein
MTANNASSDAQNNKQSTASPLSIHQSPARVVLEGFEAAICEISTVRVTITAAVGKGARVTLYRLIVKIV